MLVESRWSLVVKGQVSVEVMNSIIRLVIPPGEGQRKLRIKEMSKRGGYKSRVELQKSIS